MIVPMKELILLVYKKNEIEALRQLRSLGVVHVKKQRAGVAEQVGPLYRQLNDTDRVLTLLEKYVSSSPVSSDSQADLTRVIDECIALEGEKKKSKTAKESLYIKRDWYAHWGDISSPKIELLRRYGIYLSLYSIPRQRTKEVPQEACVVRVRRDAQNDYVAVFSRDRNFSLSFPQIEMPLEGKEVINAEIYTINKRLAAIEKRFTELSAYIPHLRRFKTTLQQKIKFTAVRSSMVEKDTILILTGYCPVSDIGKVETAADRLGWGILIQEPDNPQEVPTLIRYPRFIALIAPIFKFMGTIPGYQEYDISPWFFIFLSIFFAMLIGDAGYGILFFLAASFLKKKYPHPKNTALTLFQVFASATIVWGALSGTWFGFERLAQFPFFREMIVDRLNSFSPQNLNFFMKLCFFIGAVHLTIAHGIVAARYCNHRYALSQIGWICVIWSVFFIAGTLVLNNPLPTGVRYMVLCGISLIVLFSNAQRNLLKGMVVTLAQLPLKLISSFGDTLSYLRLFAVGYASVMVASTFNQMAGSVGFASVVQGIGAVLILIGGHSLNIVLGVMAVLVHGIRLNMLEFSGHLDMEWSGFAYEPFREE